MRERATVFFFLWFREWSSMEQRICCWNGRTDTRPSPSSSGVWLCRRWSACGLSLCHAWFSGETLLASSWFLWYHIFNLQCSSLLIQILRHIILWWCMPVAAVRYNSYQVMIETQRSFCL